MSEENKKKESSDLEELKKQLQECQKKRDEYLAGWQRAKADFINHKKEEMERMKSFFKYAAEEFIFKILPVIDNFNLAEKRLLEKGKNPEVEGFLRIKKQLEDFLKNEGVEEIKAAGQRFNPDLHEAVEQVEMKDKESGSIIEEVQKGYKINGRLLRPAKVKVVK